RNVNSVGKIIDIAASTGATVISSVQFGIEDNSAAYNNAFKKAIDNAKLKASVLANEAGLDNLEIAFVKEISHQPQGHIGFARHDYAMFSETGIAHDTLIMHGDIEVTASVKVVFKGLDFAIQNLNSM
ncbi:MAG: SIMPL domain-containing protein, partial [Firmicutes bacterium]|nr:SIMPL domain-containing protein [Bacillota bacterium]